jgi:hypothetical protein
MTGAFKAQVEATPAVVITYRGMSEHHEVIRRLAVLPNGAIRMRAKSHPL